MTTAFEARLNQLLLRWQELRVQGKVLAAEELCADCPDLLDEFKKRIQNTEEDDQLSTTKTDGGGSLPPTAKGSLSQTGALDIPSSGTDLLADPFSIPGYEILQEVGRGGMGVVYKARQLQLNRIVALKVIRKERLADPLAIRRFRREVEAAARLHHPNIVVVYDADQIGAVHFFSMEFVEGITLQRLIQSSGPLPVPQACDYIRQAALALEHAFEQGLVHRDIKPANLILSRPAGSGERPAEKIIKGIKDSSPVVPLPSKPYGVVKILDMGLARLAQWSADETTTFLTQAGVVMGTPDFIAPEQVDDPHSADIRADIYSLGCTFYFLLTGKVPFPETKLIKKLDSHRWTKPPDLNRFRRDVPREAISVLTKMMAKQPKDRFQTPGQVAAVLEHFSGVKGVFSLPAQTSEAAPARVETAGPASPTSPEPHLVLLGHSKIVWSAAFAPDSRRILSAGQDKTVRLWDVETGKQLRRFDQSSTEVNSVAFSPDGARALSGGDDKLVRLWEVETGRELQRLDKHTGEIYGVAFSPDGRRALSGSMDQAVRLWDVETGQQLKRFGRAMTSRHWDAVLSVAFSADGKRAISASRDQSIRLWDVETGQEVRCFIGHTDWVYSVAISPDGTKVLSGSADRTMRLWEVETGKEIRRFEGQKRSVHTVALSPDGRLALSGSHDHTACLWDGASGQLKQRFEGHKGIVTGVAFAPDGKLALSAGADGRICLWKLTE